jgi:adenosylcobinamide-GDP ribazoletransferase
MRRAVAFLTPLGAARAPDPSTLGWFAPVGVAVGFALGALWWSVRHAWPPGVAAAIVVAADLAITGMLHVDGLMDSADGLLPPMDRSRRLEVMATPDVGAFGIAAGGATGLLRWSALAALRPAPLLLGGLWGLSRAFMAVIVSTQPYARGPGGLARAFLPDSTSAGHPPGWRGLLSGSGVTVLAGLAAAAALVLLWKWVAGAAALAAALVTAAAVVAFARRRIGGFTGDVVGAAGVLAETAGLVVAAASW